MPKERKEVEISLKNAVTVEDVTTLFKELVSFVKGVKTTLEGLFSTFKTEVRKELDQASQSQTEANKAMSGRVDSVKELVFSESRTIQRLIEQKVNEVRGEMPEMPDLMPMHEEMERRISEVETKIPTLSEISPQFDATEIERKVEEHEREIEELKKRPTGTLGGGRITDVALQSAMNRVVKQETPAGTFNGSNTDFTVNSTIHAVLSFELNSRVISLGEYSIIGGYRKTIRFDTAPSAAYSGKSFVITFL